MTRRPLFGATLTLAGALLFGLATPAAKVLLGDLPPVLLAGLLYSGAAVGLAVVDASLRVVGLTRAPRLHGGQWRWAGLSVLVGGLAAPLLLLLGLDRTPASSGSLLLNLEAPLTALFAFYAFGEFVSRRLVAGIAAMTAGAVLVSWQGSPDATGVLGSLLVVASSCAWALDNNIVRRIADADPVQIATIRSAVAAVTYLAVALAMGETLPSLAVALVCGLLGFFGFGLALVLFVMGLRHLGAARAAAFFAAGPFVGAVVSVALLEEPLTAALVVASAFMALGAWLTLGRSNHAEDPRAASQAGAGPWNHA